jgi:DNA polymerase III epsilon subunit-like protein
MQVMIDVETLGSGKNGRVIQIGAVGFDFNEGVLEVHELLQMEDRCFNMRIAPYAGATEETGNHEFWDDPKQAPALTEIQRMDEVPLAEVLAKFSKFMKGWLGTRGKVWAKPPQYDLRLISDAYDLAGIERPWHYRHEHDLRTLMYIARQVPLSGFKAPDVTHSKLIPHFALHDAVEQAVICQAAYRSLSHFAGVRSVKNRDRLSALPTGDDYGEQSE